MTEPTTLGDTAALNRISQILANRGMDTAPGPVDDDPSPNEPGHPAYHHQRRVEAAMDKWRAVTPRRYQRATTDDASVLAWVAKVRDLEEGGEVPSLLLWGPTGTGKTHHAYAAARLLAEAGPTRYGFWATAMPDLYAALRPSAAPDVERERTMRRVMDVPLLLLDDLGTAKASEWTEEITYRVINHRYNQCLPTMFTTNNPPKAFPDMCGDRIASRLVGMTTRVQMDGPDRRYPR